MSGPAVGAGAQGVGIQEGLHSHPTGSASGWARRATCTRAETSSLPSYQATGVHPRPSPSPSPATRALRAAVVLVRRCLRGLRGQLAWPQPSRHGPVELSGWLRVGWAQGDCRLTLRPFSLFAWPRAVEGGLVTQRAMFSLSRTPARRIDVEEKTAGNSRVKRHRRSSTA